MLALSFFAGCSEEKIVLVNDIYIEQCSNGLNLTVGEQKTLEAVVEPENATFKGITWETEDSNIAMVNADGLVHAVSQGKTTLRAISGEKTATCDVTVSIPIASIWIEQCPATLLLGSQKQLSATVSPANATNQTLTWESDNPEVASVDENGLVSALSPGEVTIRVLSKEDGEKTTSCKMTVTVLVEDVSLEHCPSTLVLGNEEPLSATVSPSNASNQALTWESDNPEVASVDENGLVSALSPGEVTIRVRSKENGEKTTSCTLRVTVLASNLSIGGCSTAPLTSGATRTLTATVSPSNATNQAVTWTSSNTSIATVNANGVVTAGTTGGAVVVTATTQDGAHQDSCAITVNVPVSGISISGCSTTSLTPNQTRTLTANVTPANATNRGVSWTTNNTNVATVNANGVVTARNNTGSAIITATTHDGNRTATCNVSVVVPVSSVSISGCSAASLLPATPSNPSSWRGLTAVVSPANATNQAVTWTSSDTRVATVVNDGSPTTVWAYLPGDTTITARTADGGRIATCNVSVRHTVEGALPGWAFGWQGSVIFGKGFTDIRGTPTVYLVTHGNIAVSFNVLNEAMIQVPSIPSGGSRTWGVNINAKTVFFNP